MDTDQFAAMFDTGAGCVSVNPEPPIRFLFIPPALAKRFYTGKRYHRASVKLSPKTWAELIPELVEICIKIHDAQRRFR